MPTQPGLSNFSQSQAQSIAELVGPGAAAISQRFVRKLSERLTERFQTDVQNLRQGFSST